MTWLRLHHTLDLSHKIKNNSLYLQFVSYFSSYVSINIVLQCFSQGISKLFVNIILN